MGRMRSAAVSALAVVVAAPCQAQAGDILTLRGEWTQFFSAAVAGSGDDAPRYGGRIDGFAVVDGERAGLWTGVSFHLHGEFVYGKNTNRVGSFLLLPVNTALNFPQSNTGAADFSYSIVQTIGKARIQAGKINLLEQGIRHAGTGDGRRSACRG